MGVTKQIPRAEWQRYFERFTNQHVLRGTDDVHQAATVEVLSPVLGDQYEANVVRLMGLVYEPRSNAFQVLLEDVDHLVFHPSEIWVIEEEGGFVSAVEVVRPDESKEIIYVRRSGVPAPLYDVPMPPR